MYMFYSRIFEKVVRAFRQLLGSLVEAQEETLSEFLEPCREDRFSFLDLARASWKKGQLEHIMKLKRFLLRYDPPGVGLEVEADDQVTVQHKNLPAKSEVSTSKEVHALVDQLIEAEPALLTRKRHREGLIQLLGRLYQVETAEEERPSEPQDAAEDPKDRDELHGQSVVLTGLSGSQQAFNGEVAVVVKAKGDKQKYEVEVKGQVVKVKGKEHLLQVSSKGPLAAGAFVAIRGLRNHVELNGCVARVAECHEESQRYEVRALDSGQLFRVKKDNVILIETTPAVLAASAAMKENREPNTSPRKEGTLPATGETDDVLEVGSTVELVGLKTAQAYNGQQAEVLSVDQVRGRYEIRLGDGSVKTIRAENVRLIQGKSPRTKRGRDKLL